MLDFITYTRYMVYGGAIGIGRKGYRLGDPLSIAMANDFFRPLTPIYGVMELQPGQVNWGTINPQPLPGAVRMWLWHQFAGGSQLVCTYRYRAPLVGYEQYHYGIVGTDGVTPTPGGKEYQTFIREINQLRKEFRTNAPLPAEYQARKTAILFNHENIWGMEMNKQTNQWSSIAHLTKYYKPLKSFGAPVDFITDSTDFNKYPVIIAPAYQQIDKALIDKMTSYVVHGGNLVLSCRTGHKDREGHLWEAPFAAPIYDLIGAAIEFYDLLMPHAQDSIALNGQKYGWKSWGEILKPKPETQVWGTYEGDFYAGKAAVTSQRLGKGTVTYVGADSNNGLLEKAVLQKLYKQLHIAVEEFPEGIAVEYRNGFGIAVNYSDHSYQLKIPADATILIGSSNLATASVTVWKLK